MKLIVGIFIILFCLTGISSLYAEMFDIKVGDDVQKVHETLGEPESYVLVGKKAVISYKRGKIELVSNKVTKVEFVSAAKAEEMRLQAEKDNNKRQDYLMQEGAALKQRKLEDARFLAQPIVDQLDFWRSFRRHYPMIDLAPVNLADMATKSAEEAKQNKSERDQNALLEAKWKLMEAEERARKAEMEASSNRYNNNSLTYGYGSYIWPTQIILPRNRLYYPVRPMPYGCIQPISPFRPGGGVSVVGGSGGGVVIGGSNGSSRTSWSFSHTVR